MTAPQSHITGRIRAEARRYPTRLPAGWTPDAYRAYLDDADGGRSPVRAHLLPPPDTTPTIAEVLSWDA